jgi:hypothetical protein
MGQPPGSDLRIGIGAGARRPGGTPPAPRLVVLVARGRHAVQCVAKRRRLATLVLSLRRQGVPQTAPVMEKAVYRPRRDRSKGYVLPRATQSAAPEETPSVPLSTRPYSRTCPRSRMAQLSEDLDKAAALSTSRPALSRRPPIAALCVLDGAAGWDYAVIDHGLGASLSPAKHQKPYERVRHFAARQERGTS